MSIYVPTHFYNSLTRLNRTILNLFNRLRVWVRLQLSRIFPIRQHQINSRFNDITVIHESENYLIINKDFDVVLNGENCENSVEKQLCKRFPNLVNLKLTFSFHFIHRLDYSTSGILCIALNKHAAACAVDAFTRRLSQKYYLALVRGHVSKQSLVIDMGIGKDERIDHTHRMCTSDKQYCSRSKSSTTKFIVLERGLYDTYPATKLLIKPITGRRHQIRVHCAEIGHTIVGDYTYSNRKDLFVDRMFLHAFRLILPTDLESLDITTCDPFDEICLKKWIPVEKINKLDDKIYNVIDEITGIRIVK